MYAMKYLVVRHAKWRCNSTSSKPTRTCTTCREWSSLGVFPTWVCPCSSLQRRARGLNLCISFRSSGSRHSRARERGGEFGRVWSSQSVFASFFLLTERSNVGRSLRRSGPYLTLCDISYSFEILLLLARITAIAPVTISAMIASAGMMLSMAPAHWPMRSGIICVVGSGGRPCSLRSFSSL